MGRVRGARLFRRRCYEVLDVGSTHDPLSRHLHRGLVALVLLTVTATILESVPILKQRYALLFHSIEFVAAAVFTLEYALHLWSITEHPLLRALPAWKARASYALSPSMIVDLVAILPFFLAIFLGTELEVLLLLRLLRFYKLARYSPGIRSLMEAVHAERRALLACLVILGGLMIVAAAVMHFVEGRAQPDKFGSIPDSMYWAIITLTTVGYGDAVPITPGGKLVAGFTAVMGLVMLALPVGIIATAFAEVIHRRDFVVTWNMVARVPLFAHLDALEIADVMRYLRSRMVEPGEVILQRDATAHAMFLIASGSVEMELKDRRLRLEEGQFFGVSAILRKERTLATVRALEQTRLLVLDRDDLAALMEQNQEIAKRVREVADSRIPLNAAAGMDEEEVHPPVERASRPGVP
jgi:voltage-gated potassium channel